MASNLNDAGKALAATNPDDEVKLDLRRDKMAKVIKVINGTKVTHHGALLYGKRWWM